MCCLLSLVYRVFQTTYSFRSVGLDQNLDYKVGVKVKLLLENIFDFFQDQNQNFIFFAFLGMAISLLIIEIKEFSSCTSNESD